MFHVPEAARQCTGPLASTAAHGNNGAFVMPSSIAGRWLRIIVSDGYGFDHVSVHVEDAKGRRKIPLWEEMCAVKAAFWDAEDVVMQLHPKESEMVNNEPHTLHLWRPQGQTIPTPPSVLVGLRGVGELRPR